jgi:hypothetical protein
MYTDVEKREALTFAINLLERHARPAGQPANAQVVHYADVLREIFSQTHTHDTNDRIVETGLIPRTVVDLGVNAAGRSRGRVSMFDHALVVKTTLETPQGTVAKYMRKVCHNPSVAESTFNDLAKRM